MRRLAIIRFPQPENGNTLAGPVEKASLSSTNITIRYFGMLHDIVGKRSESLSIDSSKNAMDLLQKLSDKNGKRFREFVFDSGGKIRSGLAFAIDGVSVQRSSLSKIKCKDISEFVILPPISGGMKR